MTTWNKIVTEDDVFCEVLEDEFGILIGQVKRFYDDAPTYAWAHGNRLGAYESDATARAAVEAQHKRGMGE